MRGGELNVNALTLAILRHLDTHPYAGAVVEGGPITFERTGDTVALVGEAPEHTEASLAFFDMTNEHVTFDERDGVITIDVQPEPLRYRPLYLGAYDVVMCERITEAP